MVLICLVGNAQTVVAQIENIPIREKDIEDEKPHTSNDSSEIQTGKFFVKQLRNSITKVQRIVSNTKFKVVMSKKYRISDSNPVRYLDQTRSGW